ncbi:MAG: serine hydrolase [Myxococcota bacterium]|nr:serine hydrolase [Myxococcota bacterium]
MPDMPEDAPALPPHPMPPLPPQEPDVPWPTQEWPESPLDDDVDAAALEDACRKLILEPDLERTGPSRSLLCIHRGRLVAEAYAGDHDGTPYGPDTPQVSWSMAKSITHALAGLLVRDGLLDPDEPAPIPAWRAPGDPRGAITTEHLMRMVDGLDFLEEYVPGQRSNVIEMLFQQGKDDVAAYAAARPAKHEPGTFWNYSSGTSCLLAYVIGQSLGQGEAGLRDFMQRELFEPIGMRTASPRFDAAGTFIGSSYVWASARDFARFGLLYLRGGVWDGKPILPEGWADHARTRTPASVDQYGAQWWLAQDGSGIFSANGFQGQFIVIDPSRDLVVVRTGDTAQELYPAVKYLLRDVTRAFPRIAR